MSEYTGSRCPACNKKFTDEDDIVVCPICGAPHHRECYNERGECVFEEEHFTGKTWIPSPSTASRKTSSSSSSSSSSSFSRSQQPARPVSMDDQEDKQAETPHSRNGRTNTQTSTGKRICKSCNSENPSTNLFCNLCGNWLGEEQGTAAPPNYGFNQYLEQQMQFDPKFALYGGLSPEDKIGEYQARDVAAYVGKSSSYYLPRFKSFSDSGKNFSFNISALLFNGFYFLYRKMYAIAAILLVVFILSTIPNVMFIKEYMEYQAFAIEVGVDEQGYPLEEYPDEKMIQLQHYANVSNRTNFIYFIISLLVSSLATKLYYNHSMKKMDKVMETLPDRTREQGKCLECEEALAKAGGVNRPIVIAAVVLIYTAMAGFLVYQWFLM